MNIEKKLKQNKQLVLGGWGRGILERLSAQGPKGSEATSHVTIRRKYIPSKKDNRLKQAPDVGRSLTCSRLTLMLPARESKKERVGEDKVCVAWGHELEVQGQWETFGVFWAEK